MSREPKGDAPQEHGMPATGIDRDADLERRDALRKLSSYAAAGYVAPAFLTLMVSKKASAASGDPPPPPP